MNHRRILSKADYWDLKGRVKAEVFVRRLTNRELAGMLGRSPGHVGAVLTPNNPTGVGLLMEIADLFGVDWSDLKARIQ